MIRIRGALLSVLILYFSELWHFHPTFVAISDIKILNRQVISKFLLVSITEDRWIVEDHVFVALCVDSLSLGGTLPRALPRVDNSTCRMQSCARNDVDWLAK